MVRRKGVGKEEGLEGKEWVGRKRKEKNQRRWWEKRRVDKVWQKK